MKRTRRNRQATAQRGVALLEFALVAPVFLALIYGIRGLATLSRARYDLAVVSHAVMREAESGVTSEAVLTALANGYVKALGLRLTDHLIVTVEPAGMAVPGASAAGPVRSLLAAAAPGVRVRVSALVPVGAILPGRWSHGFPMQCSSVCLIGCWKSPMGMLKKVLSVPEPDQVGPIR